MSRYRKTSRAEQDLLDIWLYIATDNIDAADRVIDQIDAACRTLARSPGLGQSRPELGQDVRSFPVRSYLVFYRKAPPTIQVLRVLHGARDIPAAFSS